MADEERPSLPQPLTYEQMMQDLTTASHKDIVFTRNPPGFSSKAKGLEKDVERVSADCAHLVTAYKNLKAYEKELPKIADGIERHITDLKTVLSSTHDEN